MNVEKMRKSRGIGPVIFTNFSRLYDKDDKAIFCFFEGEDSKYYGHRINSVIKDKTHFLNCGGKKEVKRVADIIRTNPSYSRAISLYFIDRDFDPLYKNSHGQNFYETPCYSIENFYITETAFRKILITEFGLSELDDDYETCMELFKDRQSEFHNSMTLLNAWIACQKDLQLAGEKTELELKNVKLNRLVKITLDQVTQLYSIRSLEDVHFPKALKIPADKILEKIEILSSFPPHQVFRGKYEIEFLRVILQQLMEDRNLLEPIYFSKYKKMKLNLSKDNIISELTQYADTPPCLNLFLTSVYQHN